MAKTRNTPRKVSRPTATEFDTDGSEEETEEEFVPEYIIDDEDLIVAGTKFDEIDFIDRNIPPRKWPEQINDRLRDLVKSLYPTYLQSLQGDIVQKISGYGDIKLYYLTLRSTKPSFILKVWEGEVRQLVHVKEFSPDTSENDMYLALKRYVDDNYKLGILDITVGIQEGMNDFVESIKHIYDGMVLGKGFFKQIQHIYRLSLGQHEGFIYHMWLVVILAEDGVARSQNIVGLCVLESTWLQTIEGDRETSIHPTQEALKEIMFDRPIGTPMTCANCREANTLYLHNVDLRTFPIASLAWFAVANHNILKGNQHLHFVDVLMATHQQFSSCTIKLVFSAKDDENNVNIYWTEVRVVPWLKLFSLDPLAQVKESCPPKSCWCKIKEN